MNTVWQFATAGNIRFGRGGRLELAHDLARYQVRRPLVVTDGTVAGLEPVQRLPDSLAPTAVVFDGCRAEPAVAVADAAIAAGHEARADAVVGIGGGSNLDVAKIVAVVLRHGGRPQDYFGFDAVPGPILPLFALPTTAGTGSEVSHSAVLTDESQGTKVSTLSRWLRPTVALIDPDLSDSCPSKVTADSGIDALVHAIEAYCNRDYQQMTGVDPQARAYEGSYCVTRLLAAEAIRLVGRALVPAYLAAQAGSPDPVARDEMALAATLAGMAFSNSGVGVVHALEYPLGALTHCGHGEGNGLLLPHVMRYNMAVRMTEFGEIARWLGVSVEGLSQRQAAESAVAAVEEIQRAIQIPRRLRDLGTPRDAIPELARKAFAIKRLMDINPQPPQPVDLEAILEQAF